MYALNDRWIWNRSFLNRGIYFDWIWGEKVKIIFSIAKRELKIYFILVILHPRGIIKKPACNSILKWSFHFAAIFCQLIYSVQLLDILMAWKCCVLNLDVPDICTDKGRDNWKIDEWEEAHSFLHLLQKLWCKSKIYLGLHVYECFPTS